MLWDANPKTHDIGSLCESIVRYGFVDPPKFDAQLGAFVYGNGRTIALRMMRDQGNEPPRGILHDDDGHWYIPVKFGVDQASRDVARALAVDHNNLTLGGEFPVWDVAKMWDESYPDLLRLLAEAEALPVSVDGDDLDALLAEIPQRPDFQSVIERFQEDPGRGTSDKNENWFYVEYYQDDRRWDELCAILTPYFKGQSKHELDSNFFYDIVMFYVAAQNA